MSLLMYHILLAPIACLADDAAPAFSGCEPGDYICEGTKGKLAIPPLDTPGADATPGASAGSASGPTVGYIWLGNLEPDNTITSATVRLKTDTPLSNLSQLTPSTTLIDVKPIVIRETKPRNDANYFRSIRVVGALQKGRTAELMDVPIQYQRSSGQVQLWGQVRVGN